jgi:hypothetical protein
MVQFAPNPNQDELTDEEARIVVKKLADNGIGPVCDQCKKPTLSLNRFVVSPLSLQKPREDGSSSVAFEGGRIMPSVVLLCQNCGNSRFFNLIILGVRKGLDGV